MRLSANHLKQSDVDDIVHMRAAEMHITPEELFARAFVEAGHARTTSITAFKRYCSKENGHEIPPVVKAFCARPLPKCNNSDCPTPDAPATFTRTGLRGQTFYFCSLACMNATPRPTVADDAVARMPMGFVEGARDVDTQEMRLVVSRNIEGLLQTRTAKQGTSMNYESQQLAWKLEMSISYVLQLRVASSKLTTERIATIAEYFGKTADWLLTRHPKDRIPDASNDHAQDSPNDRESSQSPPPASTRGVAGSAEEAELLGLYTRLKADAAKLPEQQAALEAIDADVAKLETQLKALKSKRSSARAVVRETKKTIARLETLRGLLGMPES